MVAQPRLMGVAGQPQPSGPIGRRRTCTKVYWLVRVRAVCPNLTRPGGLFLDDQAPRVVLRPGPQPGYKQIVGLLLELSAVWIL